MNTSHRTVDLNQGGTYFLLPNPIGNATRYTTIPITLSAASNVTASFVTIDGGSVTPSGADTFLILYGPGGFNPA